MDHRTITSPTLTDDRAITVAGLDEGLNRRLSDELDAYNADATAGTPAAEEMSVRVESGGELVAGVAGWTWGQAAGIAMAWVRADQRGTGVGAAAIRAFEDEARRRGADHVFVSSFTFQAPGFYRRLGYSEIFRWDGVPTTGNDDVHMRKQL